MEHIPRAHPRSCMQLEICLCFAYEHVCVTCMSTCTWIHDHLFSILQEEKGSPVVMVLQPFRMCSYLLLSIRDTRLAFATLINSQRARAFRIW